MAVALFDRGMFEHVNNLLHILCIQSDLTLCEFAEYDVLVSIRELAFNFELSFCPAENVPLDEVPKLLHTLLTHLDFNR